MADRNVTVLLTLKGSGDAPKALKDCAAAADSAAKGVGKFEQSSSKIDFSKVTSASKAYGDVAKHATEASKAIAGMNAEAAKAWAPGAAPARAGAPGGAPGPQQQQPKFAPEVPKEPKGAKEPQAAQGLPGLLGINEGALKEVAQLGAMAGGVAAAISGIGKAMSGAAVALDHLTNSSISTDKAIARIGESIPVIGDLVKGMRDIADVVSGKNKAIREAGRDGAIATARSGAELTAFQNNLPLQQEISTINAQAGMFNLPAVPGVGGIGGALPGATQAEKDRQRAQRDVASSSVVQAEAQRNREELEVQLSAAEKARKRSQEAFEAGKTDRADKEKARSSGATTDELRNRFGASGGNPLFETLGKLENKIRNNPLGLQASGPAPGVAGFGQAAYKSSVADAATIKAGGELKSRLAEEEKLRTQLIASTKLEAEAVKATEEAKRRERQASIALLKDELALQKDKENQLRGEATSFGSLDASQQFSAIQAAKQFKEKGFETLTPEQRAILQQAGAGKSLAEEAQKFALKDDGFKEFQAALGNESDLDAIVKKRVNLEAEVDVKINLDEEKFANAFKDSVVPLLEKLVEQNKAFIALAEVKVKLDQDLTNANNQ